MHRPLALCVAVLFGFATAGLAQSNVSLGGIAVDTGAAIEVTAESLAVDQTNGRAVFEGDVVIGQGELRLSAARVEVTYAEGSAEVSSLIATGGITFVTAEEAAEAERAEYDVAAGLLTLNGDVLLTQGPSAISAEQMIINVETGAAQLDGRVRTILQQGNN